MNCNIEIKLNDEVIDKLQNECADKALELTAEAIKSDIISRKVTPKDTGELERSGFVEKVKDMVYAIIFDTPYARRWYFNLPNEDGKKATFQQTKNTNAKDHWMDYYLTDEKGIQWLKDTYATFLKQVSGGIIT